jgi:general secretion pathway protein D
VKKILTLSFLLVGVGLFAEPKFTPVPGISETTEARTRPTDVAKSKVVVITNAPIPVETLPPAGTPASPPKAAKSKAMVITNAPAPVEMLPPVVTPASPPKAAKSTAVVVPNAFAPVETLPPVVTPARPEKAAKSKAAVVPNASAPVETLPPVVTPARPKSEVVKSPAVKAATGRAPSPAIMSKPSAPKTAAAAPVTATVSKPSVPQKAPASTAPAVATEGWVPATPSAQTTAAPVTPPPVAEPVAPVAAPIAEPVAAPVAAPVAVPVLEPLVPVEPETAPVEPKPSAPPAVPAPAPTPATPATKSAAVVASASAPPKVSPVLPSLPMPAASVAIPPPPTAAPAPVPSKEAPPVVRKAPGAARPAPVPLPGADEIVPPGMIRFQATPLEQVLDFYAELVNRTILRPASLPAVSITIKTQTELTKKEALQALDSVLGLNQITMIPVGEKFVKCVPVGQANQEAAPISSMTADDMPEIGQYVTHVVQLKYAKPSELTQVLQPFAKIPNSIQPIDGNQILILRDYTENVKRMLELIEKIDVSVPSEFISEVIPIKYALAGDIANALNSVGGGATSAIGSGGAGTRAGTGTTAPRMGSTTTQPGVTQPGGLVGARTGQPQTTQPSFAQRLQNIIARAGSSGEFQLIGPNKIIPDERTNSLLVFASREDMQMIKDIISKLDVVLAQVLIEAVILEVSLSDSREVGVSYIQHPQTKGNITGVGALFNNKSFLTPNNFVVGTGTNASGNLTSGFSYLTSFGQDLDVTLTAIAQDSRVNILSRPRIQTSHAVPASLFIGDTVPYITGTSYGDFGNINTRSTYQEKRVGISLDVLPLINPDGLVVMDIQQNIQQLGPTVKVDQNDVPTTTERSASAKVAVRDRETVILGGFISETKSKTKSGVPLLKDIPLLGNLFRSTSDSSKRVELIVLMRPTVLPTPEAAAAQARVEQDRLPGVRRARTEFDKDEISRLKASEKYPTAAERDQKSRAAEIK